MARSTTEILIYFLATWRLSILITQEEGPGMVFSKIRKTFGAELFIEDWDILPWYSKLLQCPYCISFWIALFFFFLRAGNKELYYALVVPLSGSGATALIEDVKNG